MKPFLSNASATPLFSWLLLAIALLRDIPIPALAQPATAPANSPPPPPNIIFILADDLGYGDLGCYGQTKIKTPNIDKLADSGMRFTSWYAGCTVCAPSRCSLMTGLHTGHARIRGNATVPLQAGDVTVAEILKQAGYKTAAFGKWGLGEEGSSGVPGKKGFDDWFGYLSQVAAHDYYPTNLNRRDPEGREREVPLPANQAGRKSSYSNDLFFQAALNYLRLNQSHSHRQTRPFFLYLPFTIPHANNELGAKTGNGMEVPDDAPYSHENWPQTEKNKAAMITRLDSYVGGLMAQLAKYHLDTNTLVIFTSDNGPHKEGGVSPRFFNSSGPFRGIKRDLYEGGIREPLIVWWPGKVRSGTTNDFVCAFWDFLPTTAAIAGASTPPGLDGISILPTLLGQPQTRNHQFLYWEFHEDGFKQAVRTGDWKGVRFGVDGPLELYNLAADLSEKTNVAAAHPDIVARIEDYLKTARTEDKNWPTKSAAQTSKKEHGL